MELNKDTTYHPKLTQDLLILILFLRVAPTELEQDEDGGYYRQGHHEQRLHDVGPCDVREQHASVLYSRRAADGSEAQFP